MAVARVPGDLHGQPRGTAGFGIEKSWWSYACSQFGVIIHYLRLSFWPSPLILDYKADPARTAIQIVPWAVMIGILLAGTAAALLRRWAVGFLGVWFFLVLAPTSSVVPVDDLIFEHRMYLALAGVAVLVAAGVYRLWIHWAKGRGNRGWAAGAAVPVIGCPGWRWRWDTRRRSGTAITSLTTRSGRTPSQAPAELRRPDHTGKRPVRNGENPGGDCLHEEALRLKPGYPEAHNNLGNILLAEKKLPEAIEHYTAQCSTSHRTSKPATISATRCSRWEDS